jgi:hypothetical protein
MAEEGPNGGEGDALTEHGRGDRMPKDMGAIDRALHVGPAECTRGNLGHSFRAERAERSDGSQKHVGAGYVRPVVFTIVEDGLAHLLRERKTGRTTIFASHTQRAIRPVDIVPLQRGHIAGPES